MPKIEEASLDEHRSRTRSRILAAAERILRTSGRGGLTMAAVSRQAGMARNSLYRYAADTDQLCDMVLEVHLPVWAQALTKALARAGTAEEVILAWTRTNLVQAGRHGHSWLMNLYTDGNDTQFRRSFLYGQPFDRGQDQTKPSDLTTDAMVDFHRQVNQPLIDAWQSLRPDDARTGVEVTRGIVQSGMRLIDALDNREGEPDPKMVSTIIEDITEATRAVIVALSKKQTETGRNDQRTLADPIRQTDQRSRAVRTNGNRRTNQANPCKDMNS